MLSALEKCKKNGGKIVSVNPIPEAGNEAFADPQDPMAMLKGGEKLTDLYLQVKINGDVAVLKAACVLMLEGRKNPILEKYLTLTLLKNTVTVTKN